MTLKHITAFFQSSVLYTISALNHQIGAPLEFNELQGAARGTDGDTVPKNSMKELWHDRMKIVEVYVLIYEIIV